MRKKIQFISMIMMFVCVSAFNSLTIAQTPTVKDSVTMGASYANEVYYNFSGGEVSSYSRDTWDIAFRTRIMSSSILTNDGKNVILYTYPKSDTSGWSTVDTANYLSWKPMFNDPNDWENGAFSRNATGGLDFGWGIYNTNSHFITGDSLFVIQLRDGSLRKLWIQVKKAGEDLVYFRYAKIDGSDEHNITLDCNLYTAKDFIGFSLETNEIVDYQPDRSLWDIVFTKYMSVQPGESGKDTVYPVTGVLNNEDVYSEKFIHVDSAFTGYNPFGWDSTRSSIGYSWKTFTGTGYKVTDSLAYFVKTRAGDVHKLVFTKFAGSSTGKIIFIKDQIAGVGIGNKKKDYNILISPNPAKDRVYITFPEAVSEMTVLEMNDLAGKVICRQNISFTGKNYSFDVTGINPGMYLLRVSSEKESFTGKVIISR